MDKEVSKKKIAIGADHAGYELKEEISDYLKAKGYEVVDFGTHSNESIDYPDLAFSTAKSVSDKETAEGILVCGTGIGMSMVANRLPGVRAAVCSSVETAKLAKQHNHANLLCLGGRMDRTDSIEDILDSWFNTDIQHGRHDRRVEKIHELTGI